MKKTIERERIQACLSFAERKPLRASLKRMFARVTMTLALMVFTARMLGATAENVSYIDGNGNSQNVNATVVTTDMGGDDTPNFNFVGTYSWFYVKNSVTLNGGYNTGGGTINIILGDGATLTVNGRLRFDYASVNIYCQSGGTGKLVVNGSSYYDGIFKINNTQTLTIYGGTVEVTNNAENGYAFSGSSLVMNGGTATFNAPTGADSYGIYANVAFNGGNLTATGWRGVEGYATLNHKATTDRISCSSYGGSVTIADGKYFKDSSGKVYAGTLTNDEKTSIASQTLQPATQSEYTFYCLIKNFSGTGTPLDPYVISTTDAWDAFCNALDGDDTWSYFCDKSWKLGKNITVSRMAGSGAGGNLTESDRPFCGTFDGGGNTLTFFHDMSDEKHCAPFRYVNGANVNGATIKNLRVEGRLSTKGLDAGGVVGRITGGEVSITNCRISVTIYSTHKGISCHGGLVGYVSEGATLRITGCEFRGRLYTGTTTDTGSTKCSGFVGYNFGTTTIKDCLYNPSRILTYIVEGKIRKSITAITNGYTFGNGNINTSNCYYEERLGTGQGRMYHKINAGENITVGFSGNGTVYDVSGITAYAKGMEYYGKPIAGASQKVSLTLSHNDPEGKSFLGYSVSSGTLSGTTNPYELTMPDVNVTVSGKWLELDLSLFGTASGADGTAEHPYTITTTDGLDLLATLVNGGMDFAGKYFELGADIPYDETKENNYTPIGNTDHYFNGTFDGRGYVVSGININRPSEKYQALFGWVFGGALRNITVTDATITGKNRVGAVVGYAPDAYTIEDCYYRNVTFGGLRDIEGDRVRALQTLTLGSKVSTTTPVTKTIGGKGYYAEGTTIELSYSGTVNDGEQVTYTVNGELIDGNKFSMPAKDVTVNAQMVSEFADYWGTGDGTATTPYVISDVSGRHLLSNMTRTGETFADKYFELDGNIDLSGSYFNGIPGTFNGTFDGGIYDGEGTLTGRHTISGIDINGTDEAGFFSLVGGWVKNLNLQGKVTISGGEAEGTTARVGGIALSVESDGHIMDCQSLLRITGGQYAKKGGVAGSNSGVVHRCLYLGMSSGDEINAVGSGSGASSSTPLYKLEGLDSPSLGTVEVTNVVSNGTIYGGCYHAAGSALTLTLTATEKEDYTLSGYYYIDKYGYEEPLNANGNGTYTLTMPSTDITIEANYSYTKLDDMTKDDQGRYLVKTMDDLRTVATASKVLGGCSGMTFLLDNDIENAGDFSGIAVGKATDDGFLGTFDDGGHTISGLNIVSDAERVGFIGNLDDDYYNGVTGTLKNLTLKNCTVTSIYSGNGYAGMLVGSCNGGKLENCRVLGGSVIASSDQDPEDYIIPSAGAIAGYCVLASDSKDNYYDQKVGVFVDGEPQAPGKCGTGDPTDALAQAMVITLADDDDNSSDIWTFRGVAAEGEDTPEFAGKTFDVTLQGRTLWKDGKWNTLCLPFSLASLTGTPLEGATVKTLTSSTFADGALTLNFTEDAKNLTSIEAGKPYIIKWAPSSEHIVSPVFQGVTLDATDRSVSFDYTEGQEKGITFCGTYDAMAFDAAEPSILFLGGANTLYYPESGAKIGAQRAYFQLDGLTAGESTSQVRAFNLRFVEDPLTEGGNFDGEGTQNGIGHTEITEITERAGAWYTIDGVKLDGKPTKKGLYIHEGRKVVVK